MAGLPQADDSLVIRTDFTDEAIWSSICSAISGPDDGFQAYVEFVNDPEFEGLTVPQLLKLIPEGSDQTFMFLVDHRTVTDPEHPLMIVDLFEERGRTFRVTPAGMAMVENNLSIANMDWEDFADNAGDDGVFRGFPE